MKKTAMHEVASAREKGGVATTLEVHCASVKYLVTASIKFDSFHFNLH